MSSVFAVDPPSREGAPRRPLFQRCLHCRAAWFAPRTLCPACGGDAIAHAPLAGPGQVAAATVVRRAPSIELRHLAPYGVVLVDMAEGFRIMAHVPLTADAPPEIGTRVEVTLHLFAGAWVPLAQPLAFS